MKRHIRGLTKYFRFVAIMGLALTVSACGVTRPMSPWGCALAGAGLGGATGIAIGSAQNGNDSIDHTLVPTAVGAAGGALLGYTVCALMPEKAPPPAAKPAPPPVAEAAPTVRKTVVLPGVNFAFGKSDLLPAARDVLDREVIPELKADPALQVLIEGHTDSVGSDAYNERLSRARATSVLEYLQSKGIEASRMQAKGLGESQPVASNDTAEGRAKNRRVEIKEIK